MNVLAAPMFFCLLLHVRRGKSLFRGHAYAAWECSLAKEANERKQQEGRAGGAQMHAITMLSA
jgi:hypothetical protein